MVQLYGTQNSTRQYDTRTFVKQSDLFFEHRTDYWSKDNPDAERTPDEWSTGEAATDPNKGHFDGSLVRLKNVEIAYQLPKKTCDRLKVKGIRLFANGNDLYLWSDMPDDREYNQYTDTGDSYFRGAYPTMKRYNFGINVNF